MIEYFKHDAQGIIVYQTDETIQFPITSMRYVKDLCLEALFTYEGYIKACKGLLKRTYKIPVVIDASTMLIPTSGIRKYDTIWFNFSAIREINTNPNDMVIVFVSGRKLVLNIKINQMMALFNDLSIIRNTKVKHFHGHSYRKCLQ